MTRRDYILIAATIRKQVARLDADCSTAFSATRTLAHSIGVGMASQNKAFDIDLFMTDCGFTPLEKGTTK